MISVLRSKNVNLWKTDFVFLFVFIKYKIHSIASNNFLLLNITDNLFYKQEYLSFVFISLLFLLCGLHVLHHKNKAP